MYSRSENPKSYIIHEQNWRLCSPYTGGGPFLNPDYIIRYKFDLQVARTSDMEVNQSSLQLGLITDSTASNLMNDVFYSWFNVCSSLVSWLGWNQSWGYIVSLEPDRVVGPNGLIGLDGLIEHHGRIRHQRLLELNWLTLSIAMITSVIDPSRLIVHTSIQIYYSNWYKTLYSPGLSGSDTVNAPTVGTESGHFVTFLGFIGSNGHGFVNPMNYIGQMKVFPA